MISKVRTAYRSIIPRSMRDVLWRLRHGLKMRKRTVNITAIPGSNIPEVHAAYRQFRTPKILTLPHDYSVGDPPVELRDLDGYKMAGTGTNQATATTMVAQLKGLGVEVKPFTVSAEQFEKYWHDARYDEDFPDYYGGDYRRFRREKAMEHFISLELMKLESGQVYIDVASSVSVVPTIFRRLYGATVYRQDLVFPKGIHGDTIGGDASNMPVSDGFADAMALHCSFEQFEGDLDIRFIREAERVLKPGGVLCILPLYLAEDYYIRTDPLIAVAENVDLGSEGVIVAIPGYNVRYARIYSPEQFHKRIVSNLGSLELTVYEVTNHREIDPNTYVNFAALLRKPLD